MSALNNVMSRAMDDLTKNISEAAVMGMTGSDNDLRS
jgi:hypothetical protein